jgi:hypothetical protein
MTDRHSQSLNEAVSGIIKMMPVSWRARGLRSLAGLAMSLAIVFQIGAILRELRVLLDAYKAAKLLRALAPALEPTPQELQVAPALSAVAPRVTTRPDPVCRDRRRLAAQPATPVADPAPDRPCAKPTPTPAPRVRASVVSPAPIPLPDPFVVVLKLPWRKNPVWATGNSFAYFVTYTERSDMFRVPRRCRGGSRPRYRRRADATAGSSGQWCFG